MICKHSPKIYSSTQHSCHLIRGLTQISQQRRVVILGIGFRFFLALMSLQQKVRISTVHIQCNNYSSL